MATEAVKLNVLACTEGSVTLNFTFEPFGTDSNMQSLTGPTAEVAAAVATAGGAAAPPATSTPPPPVDLLGDLLGDFSDAPAPAAAAAPPPGAMGGMMGGMMGDDLLSLLDAPAQAPGVAADTDAAERHQGEDPVGEEEITLELTPDAPELAKPQLV